MLRALQFVLSLVTVCMGSCSGLVLLPAKHHSVSTDRDGTADFVGGAAAACIAARQQAYRTKGKINKRRQAK